MGTRRLSSIARNTLLPILLTILAVIVSPDAASQVVKGDEPNRGGAINLQTLDPAIALEHLHVAEGYEVNLFASEQDFPLANPVSLTFDTRGRLWVSTMPTYPQRLPDEEPHDNILILEDIDHDGRADRHTVFIDGLHLPAGFELGDGGVYIAQQPNLMFARDTDGDDIADETELLLHGFGTEDSHHAISVFQWGPGGGLYFQEGTFHHSQVETPYGPVRLVDAGIFRYKPRRHGLEVFVSYRFANPWGHVFDRWGQNFIADASGGSNYFGSAMTGKVYYPDKHGPLKVFTSIVRPTAGAEIVRSRQFPDEAQGNFLVNNTIGFQGIKQHRMIEEGSGFTSEELEPLLYSDDINFRPVDIQFGPDGALYIVDWFNPLIGHMQYSIRDPNRDHGHGRIWRITYKDRALLTPPRIDGAPIPALLELLKTYEDRTRYRVRIELRNRDAREVATALDDWVTGLDPGDPDHEHHLLEALWTHQTINVVNEALLARVLASPEARARAAATRVLRYWRDDITDPLGTLETLVNDPHPRVRLEALLALSFFPEPRATELAVQSMQHPMDYYLDYVLKETVTTLEPQWKPALQSGRFHTTNQTQAERYLLSRISVSSLKDFAKSAAVYEALLTRPYVRRADRMNALHSLARISGMGVTRKWLEIAEELDQAKPWADRELIADLNKVLVRLKPKELARERAALQRLTTEALTGVLREGAYAALMVANRSGDAAWNLAQRDARSLDDFLRALLIVPDTDIRNALYPTIEALLDARPQTTLLDDQGPQARYLRIELPGSRRELRLAEVDVYSAGENIARNAQASQSSTYQKGAAENAVDGNREGTYGDGAVSRSRGEENPWWELDLGTEQPIQSLRIWYPLEGTRGDWLNGFTLRLLDNDRRDVFLREDLPAPLHDRKWDLNRDSDRETTRAVIRILGATDVKPQRRFRRLATLAGNGVEVETVVAALAGIPEDRWPTEALQPLAHDLVAYLEGVPIERLSEAPVQGVFKLGDRIARALPTQVQPTLRAEFANLGITVLTLRPVPHEMLYEQREFTVRAGRPVEIVFENIDIMPHNVVVTAPGKMEDVGRAADAMQTETDAQARSYIPESDDVLFATALLNPGKRARLTFVAPETPDDYPYVCTYPAHWITMNGILHVVEEIDPALLLAQSAKPAASTTPLRSLVQFWTLDDLQPSLAQVQANRSFQRGREMFDVAGCIKCHRMNDDGGAIGPDLTAVHDKYTAVGLLEHILDPSLEVAEEYQAYQVETRTEFYSGPIVSQDDRAVRIRTNPMKPEEITEIAREKILLIEPSPLSTMPQDLLITLERTEILDLIAYLLSGGDEHHAAFAK